MSLGCGLQVLTPMPLLFCCLISLEWKSGSWHQQGPGAQQMEKGAGLLRTWRGPVRSRLEAVWPMGDQIPSLRQWLRRAQTQLQKHLASSSLVCFSCLLTGGDFCLRSEGEMPLHSLEFTIIKGGTFPRAT